MAHRIVSLLPSTTEIVCALGQGPLLVGRSHECDCPPEVRALPALTAPRTEMPRAGAAIHERVEALLREALGLYLVDAELLARLAPTVVITQVQCEVCAVTLEDVRAALGQLARGGGEAPRLVATNPVALDELFADIERVADALDVPERGRALSARLRGRLAEVAARAAPAKGPRPRVATLEWLSPLMAGGNWMPELVEMAGAENLFGQAGAHSPWLTWEALVAADPDVIGIFPCGFSLERALEETGTLAADPRFAGLRAVRERRVFVGDGNLFFNRPGPRIVETLEILAEALHPERCRFGHEGTGFVRWPRP